MIVNKKVYLMQVNNSIKSKRRRELCENIQLHCNYNLFDNCNIFPTVARVQAYRVLLDLGLRHEFYY